MAKTLILGAGFGGITVATELKRVLGGDHEVVLVDRHTHFFMGLRKLWALVGIGTIEEGSRPRARLARTGIRFLQRRIQSIEPSRRRVRTDQGDLEADYLVVALGAESKPELVPGLTEHAHNVWEVGGVPALESALEDFAGGRVLIFIAGVPYTCPPAPYECSMLLDDHFRERGIRADVAMTVATVQPMLLPNAGRAGSDWLAAQLAERGIEFRVGCRIERFEAGGVVLSEEALAADLIIGVPPHRVPSVVQASGLTGDGDWIRVDPATLETAHERVFAIGDVTGIKLANGLPLPKAGIMAELEGRRVAAAIAADVRSEPPPAAFDGRGFCFMEMGKTRATLIEGDFFAQPQPRVELRDVSARHAEDKRRFEAERLAAWFGE